MRRPGAKEERGELCWPGPVASGQCLLTPGRVTPDSGRAKGRSSEHLPGASGSARRVAPVPRELGHAPNTPRGEEQGWPRCSHRPGPAALPGASSGGRRDSRGYGGRGAPARSPPGPRPGSERDTGGTGTGRGTAAGITLRYVPWLSLEPPGAQPAGSPAASSPGQPGKGKGNPTRETPFAKKKGQRKADSAYFSCLAFSWMALSTPGGAGGTPCWSRHVARCR